MYKFNESDKKLFKVRRNVVAGELVSIELELYKDDSKINLQGGEEFVTGFLNSDPWEA